MGNEDMLWSCVAFNGGIAEQQQAPCGAISAATVCLGLHYRCPPDERERAKQARNDARRDAGELVRSFTENFGNITCRELLGFDFSDEKARNQAIESGNWREKCDGYVRFVIDKLYELDGRRGVSA